MYNKWDKDLDLTQKEGILKQIQEQLLPGWKLYSIEKEKHNIFEMFDQNAGIDLIAEKDGDLLTIANRVQWDRPEWKDYETFTIRKSRHTGSKTEFEKRSNAICKNRLYPILTCQSYFDLGELKFYRGAIMYTKDLISSVEENGKTGASDNVFYIKEWKDIKKEGYYIKIEKS